MKDEEHRWVLSDQKSALEWCKIRNEQGIACTLDILGEDNKDETKVIRTMNSSKSLIGAVHRHNLNASLSVKLTSLGATFDRELCSENLLTLFEAAQLAPVSLELDMEGSPLVDFTLDLAIQCSEQEYPLTLAIQAYLDRTQNDIDKVLAHEIKIRLVKGAYKGDLGDFKEIQERFKILFDLLMDNGKPFLVGTHNAELLAWMKERATGNKDMVGFGFLKGLSDLTKVTMAREGWRVTEYVPFGKDKGAYELRRKRYLRTLENLGRAPVP